MSVEFTKAVPGGASRVRLGNEVATAVNTLAGTRVVESIFSDETPMRFLAAQALTGPEDAAADAAITAHDGTEPQDYSAVPDDTWYATSAGIVQGTGELADDSWCWYRTGTTLIYQTRIAQVWTNVFRIVQGGTTPEYWTGAAWVALSATGAAPAAHATSHQNGGSDEISVAGLSGLLADAQTALAHTHAQADVTGLVADLAAKEAAGTAAAAVAAHEAAADPHTGYQKESEKGAANGYASLGAGTLVPVAQLGSGAPDGTKFLRDDGTFVTPSGAADGLGPDGDKGDITVGGTGTTLTIDPGAVTFAKMQAVGASVFLGNDAAGTAVEELSPTVATALLNAMVGDSGAGGTKGMAPAPAAGDAAAGKFLKADGTWAAPAGGSGLTHPQVLARSMGA